MRLVTGRRAKFSLSDLNRSWLKLRDRILHLPFYVHNCPEAIVLQFEDKVGIVERLWVYEIKFDGYRALAINACGKLSLYSRRRKSFSRQYQHVFDALRYLPQNTVVDGEIVALDDAGRPNFNFLQHSRSQAKRIFYFVFDLLIYDNRNLMQLPLLERREMLKPKITFQSPRIRIADYFERGQLEHKTTLQISRSFFSS